MTKPRPAPAKPQTPPPPPAAEQPAEAAAEEQSTGGGGGAPAHPSEPMDTDKPGEAEPPSPAA